MAVVLQFQWRPTEGPHSSDQATSGTSGRACLCSGSWWSTHCSACCDCTFSSSCLSNCHSSTFLTAGEPPPHTIHHTSYTTHHTHTSESLEVFPPPSSTSHPSPTSHSHASSSLSFPSSPHLSLPPLPLISLSPPSLPPSLPPLPPLISPSLFPSFLFLFPLTNLLYSLFP